MEIILNMKIKITKEFQPCRKCNTPVIRKIPKNKHKDGQKYYFKAYLICPKCGVMYMLENEKVFLKTLKI